MHQPSSSTKVEREDTEKTKLITDAIDNMSNEELRHRLKDAAKVIPDHLMAFFGDSPNSSVSDPPPAWCKCGKCETMEDARMNVCCKTTSCITTRAEFTNVCLRHDVLEVANILNWSHQTNLKGHFQQVMEYIADIILHFPILNKKRCTRYLQFFFVSFLSRDPQFPDSHSQTNSVPYPPIPKLFYLFLNLLFWHNTDGACIRI